MTTVVLDEVTTGDGVPTAAPFKISEQATKNSVTFKWTPTSSDSIRAWRVRFAPLNRNSGTLIAKRGMVCGSGDRCGEATARCLLMTSGTQVTTTVADAALPPEADGEYTVKIYAMSVAQGWSS
jgi:hypothetical protein